MYADNTIIFLKPTNTNVTNLKDLLNFGAVTGLQTNFQKTSITPIRRNNIDTDSVLAGLRVTCTYFLLKYLGLSLYPIGLRKMDFQPLIDKEP
jgi:hypothetical protein